jgi:hypothetical protein
MNQLSNQFGVPYPSYANEEYEQLTEGSQVPDCEVKQD